MLARRNGQGRQKPANDATTKQFRKFKGMNVVDSRVAIEDDEFAWLENAMTIGNGAIQILNHQGSAIATFTQGVARLFRMVLNGSPYLIVVGNDGSMTQLTPGGVQVTICGAGVVSTSVTVAMWQGTTLLILDPTFGYFSWDGTTFQTIDITVLGSAIAVFQGRVWIIRGRTIQFTAPNTFSSFAVGDGAGDTVLTDEAFSGDIVAAVSALEQLWLVGESSVEALANVTSTGASPNVVTTFSLTNIVTNIGTSAQFTAIGYLRSLAFASPFGVYALAGVTPQKISEKLDGLFPDIDLTGASAAVGVIQNLLCLVFLVTYNGQSAINAGPTPLLLIFYNGKWSVGSQGGLVWITDLVVNGVAQIWGTDGTTVYRLFGADASTEVAHRVKWKLSDFGLATRLKQCLRSGLEVSASTDIAPVMLIENETSDQESADLLLTNQVTWQNNQGQEVQFQNNSGELVTWRAQGLVLSRQNSDMWGAFIGWTVQGTSAPYRIQGVQLQIKEDPDEWLTPVTAETIGGA